MVGCDFVRPIDFLQMFLEAFVSDGVLFFVCKFVVDLHFQTNKCANSCSRLMFLLNKIQSRIEKYCLKQPLAPN